MCSLVFKDVSVPVGEKDILRGRIERERGTVVMALSQHPNGRSSRGFVRSVHSKPVIGPLCDLICVYLLCSP